MYKLKKTFIVIIATTIFSHQALAEEESWYLGLGIGSAMVSHNNNNLVNKYPNLSASPSAETNHVGLRTFLGYWLDPYLGVELGYQNTPQYKANAGSNQVNIYGLDNISIAVVARKSVGKHTVFAKVGLSQWQIFCKESGCGGVIESGQDLMYGLGADINLYGSSDRVMRIEWEKTAIDSIYIDSLNTIGLSIVFNFDSTQ